MTLFIAYLIVFLLAAIPFFEIVGVIPIGVIAGLHAVPVTILAFIGNMLTILLIILLMDKIIGWFEKRKEKNPEKSKKRERRAARVWKRYGLPGLAIISPILIGSHLGVILAMGFGGTRKQIAVWMTASIFFWAIVTGIVSHYGVDFIFSQTGRSGFLEDLLKR
ncbi:small multi-drug export protein [Pueribacillus sp. YX66]|uniref:small multi-drug export protein n=1 Tax=Pueribacillus sp. YX66 TaxID=3229242 RepID=UPI00358D556A